MFPMGLFVPSRTYKIFIELMCFQSPAGMTLSKNLCCLCCTSGPISALLSLPRRGYVPGDIVPVAVEIENLSSRKIESASITLKMVISAENHRYGNKLCLFYFSIKYAGNILRGFFLPILTNSISFNADDKFPQP